MKAQNSDVIRHNVVPHRSQNTVSSKPQPCVCNSLRVHNEPMLMSLNWPLTSCLGDKAEGTWPSPPPPQMSYVITLGQMCTGLQKRTEVPSLRSDWPASNSDANGYKFSLRKLHSNPSCTSLVKLILTSCLLHWQQLQLSYPCNPKLWTHKLVAIEQFGIWQGRTCSCF